MIALGIDIGSSSIKVALLDAGKGKSLATASYPPDEMEIVAKKVDWAEQDPDVWMLNLEKAIDILKVSHNNLLKEVGAIGISYQMHGLVIVDKNGKPLRNSIIWCDSRAVTTGNRAFQELGENYCLGNLLNSPGNFTASKLGWVKENEHQLFDKVFKIMLPGDYIAFRLTDEIRTTNSGLSEGIFWDFKKRSVSEEVMNYFGFTSDFLPDVCDTFSVQGYLNKKMASRLGMRAGVPVSYRAGDQPNNALSLNVLNPGEVAATAGTSGVVYGVTNKPNHDPLSRVNTFLHVNNSAENQRLGVLLCLNSIGILNSWARQQISGSKYNYDEINRIANTSPEGAEGLLVLPFGNGAERVLENRNIGASFHNLNLISHKQSHIFRAIQEGIAFAFNYGIEIMKGVGLNPSVIRAGKANMFLSSLFASTLSNISGAQIELFNTNGAEGAARGAAIGSGFFKDANEAFSGLKVVQTIEPESNTGISNFYDKWKSILDTSLGKENK